MKLSNIGFSSLAAVLLIGVLSACVQLGANEPLEPDNNRVSDFLTQAGLQGLADNFVQCSDPRPEICYEIYQPVCALRDNGTRCITTPCPATEQVTYANDCKACADPSVIGFISGGECGEALTAN